MIQKSTKPTSKLLQATFPEASKDGRFLTLGDQRMHFIDTEDDRSGGSPILMVHGNPTWSFLWRKVIRRFRSTHRMIAVDHIGCGFSDKPEDYLYCLDQHIENLTRLVESLDLRDLTIIAHDWGGAISMGMAKQMRDRIGRVILTNTACFPPPFIPYRIQLCRIPVLGKWSVQGLNLFARAATKMTTVRRLDREIKSSFLAPYDGWRNRTAIYEFVKDIPTRPEQKTWQTLLEIETSLERLADIPVQLIWGMQDWCFRPQCLERLFELMPHARVERLDNAGHYLIEDEPAHVLETIDQFLQQSG